MEQPLLYNRITGKTETEISFHRDNLFFLYHNFIGKVITRGLLNKHFLSVWYGRKMKKPASKKLIPGFIEQYAVDISQIKFPLNSYKSFNDFFIRELKEGARPVDRNPDHLISPADARLLVFDLSERSSLPVKGYWYSLYQLLEDKSLEQEFSDGWCFVYRLAPSDYHRYHYIDNGSHEKVKRIKGVLNSVNPIALSSMKHLLGKNYREMTLLHTKNFGDVIQLEVGALLVGKIIQKHPGKYEFQRGEEKGWFEYGGSTVIQLFHKDAIIPDEDILNFSAQGIETIVKMGEKTGKKK